LSGFNNLKEYKKMGYLEILVALAPGMLTAVLGLVVTLWEPMKMRLKEYREVPEMVERVREIAHDLSLLGSGAAAYIGYRDEDIVLIAFTFAWFVAFSTIANRAALWATELRERDEVKAHRKMAGTVRSIARDVVRAELERSKKDI
jgi:hypothetical protein